MKKVYILFICLLSLLAHGQVSKTINLTTAGTLSNQLTTIEKSSITNLTVTGSIDARDFKCMRDEITLLEVVDLSSVTITAFNGIGGTYNYQTTYSYPANETPTMAFYIDGSSTGKTSLKTVHLPTSISSIGSMTFYGCNNLKNIDIPTNITSIQTGAFCYCHGLTGTLNIGAQIKSLDDYAYGICNGITAFVVADGNPNYSSLDGIIYDKNQRTVYQCPAGKVGSISIPSTVTTIWNAAFRECLKLTGNLILPSTLTSIGEHAFSFCSGLTGDLVIPESVNFIGGWAFFSCTGFQSFKLLSTTPPTLAYTYCFLNTTSPIYVPAASIDAYKTASEWSEYTTRFVGFGSYYSGFVASSFAGGDGTAINPYQISNAGELALLEHLVNTTDNYTNNSTNYSFGKYFILTANIDLGGPSIKWSPIGNIDSQWTNDNKFEGNFDGKNFEIMNMNVEINGSGKLLYSGLFGYTSTESCIKNLKITSTSTVKVTGLGVQMHNFAGGIVAFNNGLIENCSNYGSVSALTDDSNYAGGIAGKSTGQIINCYNIGEVKVDGMTMSEKNAGGVVGYNEGIVKDCYNSGAISALNGIYNYAGGIVGESYSDKNIENCYNSGIINISGGSWSNYVGGIVGYLTKGDVINAGNVGNLSISGDAPCYIGGISGKAQGSILNCYNKGNLNCTNKYGSRMGGIVSEGWGIRNCYNSGKFYNTSTYSIIGNIVAESSIDAVKNSYAFSIDSINKDIQLIGNVTNSETNTYISSFDLISAFKQPVNIENNSGDTQEYLTSALNSWVASNTSSSGTPYKTWLSVKTYNYGFPIFGTLIQTPVIITQPTNQSALATQKVTFNVLVQAPAIGFSLTYNWQTSVDAGITWTFIDGATNASFTTESLNVNDNNKRFRCVISTTDNFVEAKINSKTAILSVNAGTPIDLFVNCGTNGTLKLNSTTIPDATSVSVIKDLATTFTVTPFPGYEVSTLTYNGVNVKSQLVNNQYTTPPVAENCSLSVTFKKSVYKISVQLGGSGTMNLNYYYGDTPAFDFTPSQGSKIQSVFYNGVDVTADLVGNVYTLPAITANGTLKVVFVTNATGVNATIDSGISVFKSGSDIYVKGTSLGDQINLYSVDGKLLQTVKSTTEGAVIQVTSSGTYLIRIKQKTYKILF